MSHRLRSALLVFALLWQSVSMVNPFAAAERLDQFAHLLVQAQGTDYPHSNLPSSLKVSAKLDHHLHAGEGLTLTGLILHLNLCIPALPPGTLCAKGSQRYTAPSLDGLLRPPQHRA